MNDASMLIFTVMVLGGALVMLYYLVGFIIALPFIALSGIFYLVLFVGRLAIAGLVALFGWLFEVVPGGFRRIRCKIRKRRRKL